MDLATQGPRVLNVALEVTLWVAAPIIILVALAGFGAWTVRSARGGIALASAAASGALLVIASVALVNIFLPIPRGFAPAVITLGLAAFVVSSRRLALDRALARSMTPWVLAATLLYRVGRPRLAYDVFLYHGGILEWIAREPTPQGLGLLHTRFAFNPGLVLLMAPFRSGGTDWNHHALVESALVVLAFVVLAAVLHQARGLGDSTLVGYVLALATLTGLFTMLRDVRVGTDLAAGLTVLAACAVAASVVRTASSRDRMAASAEFGLLGLLVVLAIVQKTSAAPAVVLLIAPFVGAFPQHHRPMLRPLLPALGVSLITGVAMAVRTWIMSGCLSYPVSLTCVDAPWAVGREQAARESAVILSWARGRSMEHTALTDLTWLGSWYGSLITSVGFTLAAAAIAIGLVVRADRSQGSADATALPGLLWVHAGASIMFWVVSAPDRRFGFAGLLALGALVLAPAFMGRSDGPGALGTPGWLFRALPVGVLVVVVAVTALGGRYFPFDGSVAHDFEVGRLASRSIGGSEWEYFYPIGDDRCGDRFPCAPSERDLVVERTGARIIFARPAG